MPVLILAIADPVAALTGKKWPYGKYSIMGESKTFAGSAMFFITAFLISITCLEFTTAYSLGMILAIAFTAGVVSSIIEAITKHGLDNISIPLSVLGVLIAAHTFAGI